jgi:hypothetical protein
VASVAKPGNGAILAGFFTAAILRGLSGTHISPKVVQTRRLMPTDGLLLHRKNHSIMLPDSI